MLKNWITIEKSVKYGNDSFIRARSYRRSLHMDLNQDEAAIMSPILPHVHYTQHELDKLYPPLKVCPPADGQEEEEEEEERRSAAQHKQMWGGGLARLGHVRG